MNFNRTRTEGRADARATDDESATTTDGTTETESTTDGTTGTNGTARTIRTTDGAKDASTDRSTDRVAVGTTDGTTDTGAAGTTGTAKDRTNSPTRTPASVAAPRRPAASPAAPTATGRATGADTDVKRTDTVATPTVGETKSQRTDTAATPQRPAAAPAAAPAGDTRTADSGRSATEKSNSVTPTSEDVDGLNRRMERAVGGFVDDPRRAVREADAVLDEAVRRLTRMVEERRDSLRGSWRGDNGDKTGTEELRVALTRYRDMTRELLNVS